MKLLLLAPSARAMAESARRACCDFLSLDFFGDADTKELCENYSLREFGEEYTIENLYKRAQKLNFTHIIYGSGFENHPELVAGLEKRGTVLGNDSQTLRRTRDWKNFFKVLERNGISFPRTEILPKKEAIAALKNSRKKYLIKPLASGGGHAIYESSNAREAEDDKRLGEKVLLQEYVSGTPASSTFVSGNDFLFLGAAEQLRGTFFNRFRYSGNVAPLKEKRAAIERMKEISHKIAEAFRLKGCNGIDFVVNKGEPYVLEVNPRIPGSAELLEKVQGFNVVEAHIRACLGESVRLKLKKSHKFYAKKILFAEKNFRYSMRKRLKFVKDVPHYGEEIPAKAPVCDVLASASTRRRCLEKLNKNEARIKSLLGLT